MTQTHLSTPVPADLDGARVFVLRGSEWGEQVAQQIRRRGGEARVVPLLDVRLTVSPALRSHLEDWARGGYDWLLLTSVNAVRAVEAAGPDLGPSGSDASGRTPRVAAVGPATERAAVQAGLPVSLTPESDFSTEGLLEVLRDAAGPAPLRFLFPVSDLTDQRMQEALGADGHEVVRVTAYETRAVAPPADLRAQLQAHAPTVVLITSGSAAQALHAHLPELPAGVAVAAIGRRSAAALAEHGSVADVVAAEQTIPGLLDAVAAHLAARRARKDLT